MQVRFCLLDCVICVKACTWIVCSNVCAGFRSNIKLWAAVPSQPTYIAFYLIALLFHPPHPLRRAIPRKAALRQRGHCEQRLPRPEGVRRGGGQGGAPACQAHRQGHQTGTLHVVRVCCLCFVPCVLWFLPVVVCNQMCDCNSLCMSTIVFKMLCLF